MGNNEIENIILKNRRISIMTKDFYKALFKKDVLIMESVKMCRYQMKELRKL